MLNLNGEDVLEERHPGAVEHLLIDLDLEEPGLRVRGIDDAVLVQFRYVHQGGFDHGADIDNVRMADVVPGNPLGFVMNNTGHAILSRIPGGSGTQGVAAAFR